MYYRIFVIGIYCYIKKKNYYHKFSNYENAQCVTEYF